MTKEKLVEKIRELLKTDGDLSFLLILKKDLNTSEKRLLFYSF